MFPGFISCVSKKKLMYLQEDQQGVSSRGFYYDDIDYRLKPQDVIGLNIFSFTSGQFDFLSGGGEETSGAATNLFLIQRDGKVELPALGEVELAGLTIKEAQDKIRLLLEDYLQSPLVRITLQTPFTFTILGEVNGPGQYTLVGQENVNIMEAIGTAGDLGVFANREKVRLIRKESGEVKMYTINLLDKELIGEPLYQLQSEDILIVDPLGAKIFRENQTVVLGLFGGAFGTLGILIFRLIGNN